MEALAALLIGALIVFLGIDNIRGGESKKHIELSGELDKREKREQEQKERARARMDELNARIEAREAEHETQKPVVDGGAAERLRREFSSGE